MKKSDLEIIKKVINNINKNIDENIKISELRFENKSYTSQSLKKLEIEFIKIMKEINKQFRKGVKKKKLQLISNYNTISTILDRLSVEKTKYYHFKNNMKKKLSPKEIKQKCILQKKIINEINIILEEKFIESFQCRVIILKEERTFK
tara:strand:+ start:938 stop:1381 length:444 start_codon:yes stop_codon:yes gene_type:complete